jgi:large subunit ribosomal protein L23
MALFGKKKNASEAEKKPAKAPKAEVVKKEEKKETAVAKREVSTGRDLSGVLLRPHVTEKATDLSMRGVYAFEVSQGANKHAVAMAVESYYKVTPIRVAIINKKAKMSKSPRTGRMVVKQHGGKKALVYLKKGEKIEFV